MADDANNIEVDAAGKHGAAALDRLIGPLAPEQFFTRHYDQAPLHCARDDPGRYSDLLTLAAVDAFVHSADLRHDMLRLVAGGDLVDPARYVGPSGRILPTAVAEAYQRGATIILPQLHLQMPSLADFCRALEGEFSAAVQANAYLTPGASRGFEPHYDQHDVFILQVAGGKTWRLFETPAAAAGGAPFERGRHEPGLVSAEFALEPGDSLYVPRGLMHEAENEAGAPSLHLSVGILARRWSDLVVEAVAALVRADPAFQRVLPPGFATRSEAREAAEQQIPPLLARLAEATSLDEAIERCARNFLHERRPSVAGVIASPRAPARLRRRPLLLWRMRHDGSDIVLVGPGGDLRFAWSEEAALIEALSGRPFDARLLPGADPSRLVERLWVNGYLEPAPNERRSTADAGNGGSGGGT